MNLFRNIPLLLFILLCYSTQAQAQQKKQQHQLSLSRAIELGLANNFKVEITKLRKDLAARNRDKGVPERYPNIDFFVSEGNIASLNNDPTTFFNGAYLKNEISGGLNVDWILFDGFQVRMKRHMLGIEEELRIGEQQLEIENAIHAIILRYYRTLIETEKLNKVKERIALTQQKYQKAKQELDYGDISNFDLLNFKNALLQDSVRFHQQEAQLKEAAIKLNHLLDIEDKNKMYTLTEKLDHSPKKYEYEYIKVDCSRLIRISKIGLQI